MLIDEINNKIQKIERERFLIKLKINTNFSEMSLNDYGKLSNDRLNLNQELKKLYSELSIINKKIEIQNKRKQKIISLNNIEYGKE